MQPMFENKKINNTVHYIISFIHSAPCLELLYLIVYALIV